MPCQNPPLSLTRVVSLRHLLNYKGVENGKLCTHMDGFRRYYLKLH